MKCTAVFFFAFAAVTSAFSPATPRVLAKARAAPVMRAEAPKFSPAALVAAVPAVLASTPAFAGESGYTHITESFGKIPALEKRVKGKRRIVKKTKARRI
mmetsp:Transcript_25416/g.57088  ORF Transcript_25416/g.57088 Transcript_25416/m.57088 type:complete len:100 (+) Transcript_25416:60-359(+)